MEKNFYKDMERKRFKFEETDLPELLVNKFAEKDLSIDKKNVSLFCKVLFKTIRNLLEQMKSKDNQVALIIYDENEKYVYSQTFKYRKNINDWIFDASFDNIRLDNHAIVLTSFGEEFQNAYIQTSSDLNIGIDDKSYIKYLASVPINTISDWLDKNAEKDKLVSVAGDGFKANICPLKEGGYHKSIIF